MKKSVGKKKVSSKRGLNLKENKKNIVKGIVLIAILLIVLILLNILINNSVLLGPSSSSSSAGQEQVGVIKALWNAFFGGIFKEGAFIDLGKYQVQITQILLLLLTALLVYSVSDFLPFFPEGKEWIKIIFALIIGILAFAFIDVDTILGIGATYEALGVALTSLVPLLILLAFSFKLKTNEKFAPYAKLLNIFMFSIFGLWMIFKWFNASQNPSPNYSAIYLVSASIALVWVFIGNAVARWVIIKRVIGKAEQRGERRTTLRVQELVSELQRLEKIINDNPGNNAQSIAEYDEKAARIRQLGVTAWGSWKR